MTLFPEENVFVFLILTVVLGGGAAYLTGRAVALTWRRLSRLALFVLLLAAALRFIHFALFGGSFLPANPGQLANWSPTFHYFLVDLIVLAILAAVGFRLTRVRQMTGQYDWLYRRNGLLAWRAKA